MAYSKNIGACLRTAFFTIEIGDTHYVAISFDGAFTESSRDYNGDLHNELIRGAYAGEGVNPGWLPKLERKPQPHDDIPPSPPTGLKIRVF
jgi:hypothetical protein